MDIKEFLKDIKKKKISIDILTEDIERLRSIAEYKTPAIDPDIDYSKVKDPHSMENMLVKIADLSIELTKLKTAYIEDIEKATKMILGMSDEKLIRLFYMRYLQFRTWDDIAMNLNISFQWVHKLHGRGLEELRNKF